MSRAYRRKRIDLRRARDALHHRAVSECHLVSVGATTDPLWLDELTRQAQSTGVAEHVNSGAAARRAGFPGGCDLLYFSVTL